MRLGKYELGEILGKDGFGTVYRATDLSLEREVAVKILHPQLTVDPDFIERFRREARLLAQLDHPNIVPVYEVGEIEGRFVIVMKLLKGGSLVELIRKGPLPYPRAIEILRYVCAGLQAAHAKGWVHRDLKPGNILLDECGQAVLTDLGLMRVAQVSSSASSSLGGVGTPFYRAPELWRGKPPATPATDVYALGCILYEMLSGKVLFSGVTPDEIITRHLVDGAVFELGWLPPQAPPGVADVVTKALARDPAGRYQEAGAFYQALLDAEKEQVRKAEEEHARIVAAEKAKQAEQRAIQEKERHRLEGKVQAGETQRQARVRLDEEKNKVGQLKVQNSLKAKNDKTGSSLHWVAGLGGAVIFFGGGLIVILIIIIFMRSFIYKPLSATTPTPAYDIISPTAAQTVQALNTQIAQTAQPQQMPPTFTLAPKVPTNTSEVLVPSTIEPTLTNSPVPPTVTLGPLDKLGRVEDVTYADGTVVNPGTTFTKTWRLTNAGTTTWTTGYAVVFFNGDAMSAPASIPITANIPPNGTLDVSVTLTAPSTAKSYTGYYKIRNAGGALFGFGINADLAIWVKITVGSPIAPTLDTGTDIMSKIKAANILVYEDVRGYPALLPRVQQAIKSMDFSGGQIVMVGDAVGDFMTQLNSSTNWDLIIVAQEARSGVRGEFWDLILKQAQKKVGLAIEVWYIDKDYYDKVDFLLDECGVTLQENWTRPANFQPLDYSIYWLQPDNPLFTIYKTVPPLVTPNIYWSGDVGDLMKISGTGDAVLLGGTKPSELSSNGVLTSCMQGRMILQTFSTHDYQETKTVALWENYIIYTLTNHFKTTN